MILSVHICGTNYHGVFQSIHCQTATNYNTVRSLPPYGPGTTLISLNIYFYIARGINERGEGESSGNCVEFIMEVTEFISVTL